MKYLKFTSLLLCIHQMGLGITVGGYLKNADHSHRNDRTYGHISSAKAGLEQTLTDLFFWGMNITKDPSNKYPKALSFSLSNFKTDRFNLLDKINNYVQNNPVIVKITITNISENKYTAEASAIILAPYSFTPLEWIDPIEIDLSASVSNPLKIGYIAAYVGDIAKYGSTPPAYAGLGTQGKFTSQDFTIDNNFSNSIFIAINNGSFTVTMQSSHATSTSYIPYKRSIIKKSLSRKYFYPDKINRLNQELLAKISQLAELKNSSCMQGPGIGGEAGLAKASRCSEAKINTQITLLESMINNINQEITEVQQYNMMQPQPM